MNLKTYASHPSHPIPTLAPVPLQVHSSTPGPPLLTSSSVAGAWWGSASVWWPPSPPSSSPSAPPPISVDSWRLSPNFLESRACWRRTVSCLVCLWWRYPTGASCWGSSEPHFSHTYIGYSTCVGLYMFIIYCCLYNYFYTMYRTHVVYIHIVWVWY